MIDKKQIGRNEVCPCGSGKKYKRCCGVGAAPKLSTSTQVPLPQQEEMKQFMEQVNPELMKNFAAAFQRLPRNQMQRIQSLMQKAASGKDIAKEAAELEKMLPPELQVIMQSFAMMAEQNKQQEQEPMTPEKAMAYVEQAAKEGRISQEEAKALIEGAAPSIQENESKTEKAPQDKSLWDKLLGRG